jgi:hypothetical protein
VAGHVGGPIGQFPKNSDVTSSVGRGLLGSGNRQTGKGVPELPIRIEDVLAALVNTAPPPWWRVIFREASAASQGQPPADLPGFTNVNSRVGAVAHNTCRIAPSATEASSKIWRESQPTKLLERDVRIKDRLLNDPLGFGAER